MPSPQVQRRVNFEPAVVEASPRQSPTSYIVPPTPAAGIHSAIGLDKIPATPGYDRGELLMHEARPSIATEMPAENFYYQPRSAYVSQHQEQTGYDELDTQMNTRYHQYVRGQTPMSVGVPITPRCQGRHDARSAYSKEESMSQQKKSYAVDQYFKSNRLSGGSDASLEDTLRDYDICAVQERLSDEELSLFFVNCLKIPARKHFLRECRSDMTYRETIRRLCHQYNSESKQSTTLVQILKLYMPTHKRENGITSEKGGHRSIRELIEQNPELLDPKFATENHKVQSLRQAVHPYAWTQFLISQIAVMCFTFSGFQNTLENSLIQHIQQIQSSMHTHYQSHGS